ncbi:MAG: YcgN family cysteine cluster protein [Pseudomonadota bacterium]
MVKLSFWKSKSLQEMDQDEWEALCDGCGKCCLNKLEDWDTGEIYWTKIGCELLDCESCQCSDYENRFKKVTDCIQLTPDIVQTLGWLPPTCAYRLINEGSDLYWWHHLISGDRETVHQAGVSIRSRAIPDDNIKPEDYENHLVDWPLEIYHEK